jgi:hypothetical protein
MAVKCPNCGGNVKTGKDVAKGDVGICKDCSQAVDLKAEEEAPAGEAPPPEASPRGEPGPPRVEDEVEPGEQVPVEEPVSE